MNRKANHNKKSVIVRPDHTIEGSSFEGIIPDPETLKELEIYAPGSTKQWMALAESEIKKRQINEGRITKTFQISTILGQILGFLSSTLVIAAGIYCIHLGNDVSGAAIITGSVANVIAAYYFKRRNSIE